MPDMAKSRASSVGKTLISEFPIAPCGHSDYAAATEL